MGSQTPPGAGSPGQPTEEEMRAYLAQLREADPVEIVAQAYTMLGTGAEVKLGRPDARVLIDALAGLVEAVGPRLPSDLVSRMRSGLSQLQMAQVQAEQAAGGAGSEGEPAAGERSAEQPDDRAGHAGQRTDAGAAPQSGQGGGAGGAPPSGQPGGPGAAGQPGAQRGGSKMTDRLWIPGRDPRPR